VKAAGPARLVASLLRPGWRTFALAAALQFATVASGIGLMATSAWLIATAGLHPSIAVLGVAIVGVRFFGLARGVLRYLERLASHGAALSLLARLRATIFDALVPLAPARLRDQSSGDLVARLVADVDELDTISVRILGPSVAAVLTAALLGAILVPRGGSLAAAAMAGLAVAGLLVPALALRAGARASAESLIRRSDLAARTTDAVQGVADLLAFNHGTLFRTELDRRSRSLVKVQVRTAGVSSAASSAVLLAGDLSALAVLALGARLVASGALDGVQLAVAVLATLAGFEAAGPLAAAWPHLGAVRAAARRTHALISGVPAVQDPPVPLPPPEGRSLEVRDLSFRFEDADRDALHGVSFSLAAGRIVAIVGASGAGKSTMAHLLLRFHDAPAGAIRLDGHDVREYRADAARARLAYADQRASILTGTIRENLCVAQADARDADLFDVLDVVALGGFVRALPDGLDTWIGEQGQRLSGGERQRLALARAVLKPSRFLVLDEPTANLDPLTERHILQAVPRLARDRGILLITHRLVGLDVASEILVLDEGHVIQRGDFAGLRAHDGWFRRMLDLQRSSILIEEMAGGRPPEATIPA
jgi:thiol reductant ABC exporter CydC subunit